MFEIRPHRSREIVRGTDGKPLRDNDGNIVRRPHIFDVEEIWLKDQHIGYCNKEPNTGISLIIPDPPKSFRDEVKAFVEQHYGHAKTKVSAPPSQSRIPDIAASEEDD